MGAHGPFEPEHDNWGHPEAHRAERENQGHNWRFYGEGSWDEREMIEDLYDGCILDVDQNIKRLVGGLRNRGELEDTLVIITSDHGEGFGEDDPLRSRVVGHVPGSHECLYHVPLLVLHPDLSSKTITNVVSLTEIPRIIRGTIEGDTPVFGNMEVWSFDFGITPQAHSIASQYTKPDVFEGKISIHYEGINNHIQKIASLDGKLLLEEIRGTEIASSEIVNGCLKVPFEEKDMIEEREQEVTPDVEKKLEQLGYM